MKLRHASIDAATRAARGLPEDLIRLCVGIEDAHDLLDDLERALLAAGAIEFDQVENKYVRVAEPDGTDAITRAVQKLAVGKEVGSDTREWLVSAPGKVILFGEHAVVHGVVSVLMIEYSYRLSCSGFSPSYLIYANPFYSRLPLQRQSISGVMVLRPPARIIAYQFTSMTSTIFITNGTSRICPGTRLHQ